MKYVHPDIVVGEPIPEIEPRIDQDRLVIVRRWNVWWRWSCVLAILLVAVSLLIRAGLVAGIGLMVALMVLWLMPIIRPKMRAEIRNVRRANSLRGDANVNAWSIPFRDNAQCQLLSLTPMVFAPLIVSGSGGLSSIFLYTGIYAFMGGLGVIIYGFHARQPGQISCDKCSYPLTGLTIDCRCPECGVWILAANYTTDCPRIRSPWFMRIGLVMSAMGGVLVYTSFVNPAAFYAPVPRAVLFNLAPADQKAFERLINSPITQEETDQLIERFISTDVFDDGAWGSYRQRQWLGEQFAVGSLSDEQVDRIIEPYLDLSISAPDTAQVGDQVALWINSANQLGYSTDFNPLLYFGGFIIGQDPTPRAQATRPDQLADIQNIKHDVPSTRRPILVSPETVWIPEEPGVIEINATIVIAIFPSRTNAQLAWGDGGHAFDVQPDWVRVINLRHTIAVEPASGGDEGG